MLTRFLIVSMFVAACGKTGAGGGGAGDNPDATVTSPKPDAPITTSTADAAAPDASVLVGHLCSQLPPPGAPAPTPPPAPSGGACPVLAAGSNAITSSGNARSFLLVLPANMQPDEELPVIFMWYWLGGSSEDFLNQGEVQAAADEQRFIAVIPNSIGASVLGTSFNTKWPFDITQLPDRMNEEFTFFDDMLGCVEHEYNVNQSCVSSAGVSAGALFTDQLAQARASTLASFISLSGGVSATIIKPWIAPKRALPGIVLWGGNGPPSMDGVKDILGCEGIGMDFSVASHDLETALVSAGNFFIECIHNCGHVEPPLDAPPGQSKFAAIWDFALNHPYWLPTGTSPYLQYGLPSSIPAWCGIGAGGATPRSDLTCPPAENPCAY